MLGILAQRDAEIKQVFKNNFFANTQTETRRSIYFTRRLATRFSIRSDRLSFDLFPSYIDRTIDSTHETHRQLPVC
jgi:hypothetical protein